MEDRIEPRRDFSNSLRQSKPEEEPSTITSKRRTKATTRDHFNEGLVPAQFKLPADLIKSLRLHSIQSGKSMSEIVLDCLTSDETVSKAWVSSKNAA